MIFIMKEKIGQKFFLGVTTVFITTALQVTYLDEKEESLKVMAANDRLGIRCILKNRQKTSRRQRKSTDAQNYKLMS